MNKPKQNKIQSRTALEQLKLFSLGSDDGKTDTFIQLHHNCSVSPFAGYTPLGTGDGTRGFKLSAFGSFRSLSFVACVGWVGRWSREGGVNLSVREEGYDSINT